MNTALTHEERRPLISAPKSEQRVPKTLAKGLVIRASKK